eukprot:3005679-Prymnesium_polylepis.1
MSKTTKTKNPAEAIGIEEERGVFLARLLPEQDGGIDVAEIVAGVPPLSRPTAAVNSKVKVHQLVGVATDVYPALSAAAAVDYVTSGGEERAAVRAAKVSCG